MLLVCPSCATSYMVDPACVGPAGRTVRCARCRATWFANAPAGDGVEAFVDGVIAEAEAEMQPATRQTSPLPEASLLNQDAGPDRIQAEDTAAEPPMLEGSPSLVPSIEHLPQPHSDAVADDAGNFSAHRRRMQVKKRKARRSSRWTVAVIVLFAINVGLIGARREVVRWFPQTASLFAAIGLPVNLRQLAFEDVHIKREGQDGAPILSIEGKIVSKANGPVEVPRLRFAARNASGQEIYVWTARPARRILAPGESVDFRSTLAKPPNEAVDVVVRFFTAQDAASGG